jgi:hypothetical protein
MKKFKFFQSIFIGLILLSLGLFIFLANKTSAGVNDFVITNFEADYFLTKDTDGAAQLKTVETITADFPAIDQNHGILRALPKKYLDNNLHLSVISIKDAAGQNLDYTTYTENDNLVLKIGDKDVYVHGPQTYVITYKSNNVIRFFDDHDEWYWDINGLDWKQQVSSLTARIHLLDAVASELQQNRVCYTGFQNSTESNCQWAVAQNSDETVLTITTTKPLSAGQTASFVLAFNTNTFTPVPQTFGRSMVP